MPSVTTSVRTKVTFASGSDFDEGVDTQVFAQSRVNEALYFAKDKDTACFRLYIHPLRGGGLMRVDHLLGTDLYRQLRLRRDANNRGLAWIDPAREMMPGELATAIGHVVKGIEARWNAYIL